MEDGKAALAELLARNQDEVLKSDDLTRPAVGAAEFDDGEDVSLNGSDPLSILRNSDKRDD